MQRSSTVNCFGGGVATKCCILSTCIRPSFMCEDQSCQCYKNHENCDFPIPKSYILDRIKKVKSRFFQTLKQIQKWYQQAIKSLKVQQDNLIMITDQQALLSQGNVGLFNDLLKQNRANQITSKLVFNCFSSLSNSYNISSKRQLNEVKLHLDKKNQQIKILLEQVRQKWKCKARPQQEIIKFSEELKHPALQIVDENKIKVKGQGYTGGSLMGFLEPTFQNTFFNERKFEFKINILSSKANLLFGVCHKKSLSGIINQFSSEIYQISGDNQVYSPKKQRTQFNFSQGDIIEISFLPFERKVTFTNKTLNIKASIIIKQKEFKPLYLFIKMVSPNDEIQYLGETTIQY